MLRVTKSNRSEKLISPLADVLREPSVGPFGEETVVVGADGVRRWLSKQLAQELGVCAQIRFVYTGTLVKEILAKVVGAPAPDDDPWRPESLQWAILAALPGLLDRDAFEPLRAYLSSGNGESEPDFGGIKAFQLARRIAGAFSRYLTFRPEMLLAWDRGSNVGAGSDLWQPLLWQALGQRLTVPHPAQWTERLLKEVKKDGFELPEEMRRLCLFGISSLPRDQVRVIAQLAKCADIHLFAISPSDKAWNKVRARRAEWQALSPRADGGLDSAEISFEEDHPLLTSLGSLGRDFQVLLEREANYEDASVDAFEEPKGETLLARLQRDVYSLTLRGSPDVPPHELDPQDDSLTFHACHGESRQVEVLLDQLLDLFANDKSLEPSDVLVLTPDVETFAPLIDAVFHGQGSAGQRLPVRVANRARRSENPLAEAVLRVLSLVGQRLTSSRVIDLLSLEPIRRRFEFDSDGVMKVADWVAGAEIRWGIDAADRVRKGQPSFDNNTWEWGLDRLLLGYAMPGRERDLFAGRLPYDEVEGSDAALLGRLVEFSQVLFRHLRACEEQRRSLPEWGDALRQLVADLTAVADDDVPQLEGVHVAIDCLPADAEAVGFNGPVSFEVPRAILEDHFDQSRAATSFLTGAITVCGMVPLRSIGHRVVCLLGLDDGAFPRATSGAGFDLAARRPALGDRSPREDDRYLFLEALLAARTHVRIFYSGQSVRDNKPLPPSVVVSELLDYLCQANRLPASEGETDEQARARVVERLVVRHPLQPFSPRYFGGGADPRLFSYAKSYVKGARALVSVPEVPEPFWNETLATPTGEEAQTLTLWELERFCLLPVAALLRSRLGLSYPRDEEPTNDREPLLLGGLARYHVGEGLLDQALAGVPNEQAGSAALQAGRLPLGTPGTCTLADLTEQVGELSRVVEDLRAGDEPREPVELDLTLAGFRFVGHVPELWPGGQVLHHYASTKAKYTLTLWVRHLALHASGPAVSERSVVVTRQTKPPFYATKGFKPIDHERAGELLADLLALYSEGRRRPLLFFPETSLAYARSYQKTIKKKTEDEARAAGRKSAGAPWRGNSFQKIAGDRDDSFVARVFGEAPPFARDYELPGLEIGEGFTFHELALRVFEPLLDELVEGMA
ncbi:MAG: exodeoxyribonuclease V subunit gamma [Planctomycetes bacterium]|nr:exodeoxyribonuclease V subunit gamma [Planctomycetota bacterium]